MILAGLYTGQRLKDLAGLTWNNVDLERNEIRLTTSKTKRRQFIPIAAPFRAYLDELAVGDDPKAPLFPDLYPFAVKDGGSARLSDQFYEILVTANLVKERPPKDKSTGKGRDGARTKTEISFHSLRHSATSLLKQAGVSESVARDLIGHDSADVSANYTHTDDASRRTAIDSLPDITKIS
jgi:integrase